MGQEQSFVSPRVRIAPPRIAIKGIGVLQGTIAWNLLSRELYVKTIVNVKKVKNVVLSLKYVQLEYILKAVMDIMVMEIIMKIMNNILVIIMNTMIMKLKKIYDINNCYLCIKIY